MKRFCQTFVTSKGDRVRVCVAAQEIELWIGTELTRLTPDDARKMAGTLLLIAGWEEAEET